ncbi:4-(cytidine 5'-diphospho)-2-C-methyl-D-erythritol kinase [Corynebacterium sp. YIM 101645]|uniref:4-diphosphocytidyl-2-C-methyl-D-erythritol kinase n=1 Tax=Corynebacterium lemuris TaxID=1859292 RepID=A0ABT2G284_9CORY|nr:4-(cytidine 5'-diphospho)-2-C-methyl-D-erythritol kinase [Corynebacterium lemuris]MCS5480397.1 4-(cytidine 5'-diphospho)-2-C-methyl-D-erythritol kinase [Corynebacterium lemuris]
MRQISARAHAKINLHLGVGDLREDGYHDLVTVFQSLSLADTVTLDISAEETVTSGSIVGALTVNGLDAASVPRDAGNLAWRAVDKLVDHYRVQFGLEEAPRVYLNIHKGIPTAGGMAGGSADAAAALVATHALLSETYPALPMATLLELAAELGSDVPFTLRGGTMLGTGRGEQLTPMLSRGTYHWALIFFREGLSTQTVFQELDRLRGEGFSFGPSLHTEDLARALMTGDPEKLADTLTNDLQIAATMLRRDVARTLDKGMQAGALAAMVSGSGPTVAFLCDSQLQAQDIIDDMIADGSAYSGSTAQGPGKGAYVID